MREANPEMPTPLTLGFERDRGLNKLLARAGVPRDYKEFLVTAITDRMRQECPDDRIVSIELLACPRFDQLYSPDGVLQPHIRVLLDVSVSVRSGDTESAVGAAVALKWADLDGTPRSSADVTFWKGSHSIDG